MIKFILTSLISTLCFAQTFATIHTTLNTNDSGAGSLRDKINNANGGDTINFDSSLGGASIILTTGEINVTNLTIIGLEDTITISGNDNSRIFHTYFNVRLENLKITNGNSSDGGAIRNKGSLYLKNCRITESQSDYGGAIYGFNNSIIISLDSCLLDHNAASVKGGAVASFKILEVTDSKLSNNSVINSSGNISGGAICAEQGSLLLANSSIQDNFVGADTRSFGGGICIGNGCEGIIENSAIINNIVFVDDAADRSGEGGGIHISAAGLVKITNTTISGNLAIGETGRAGGIYYFGQSTSPISQRLELTNNTIVNNRTESWHSFFTSKGGGIYTDYIISANTGVDVKNCILFNNSLNNLDTANGYEIFGKINTFGGNLFYETGGTEYADSTGIYSDGYYIDPGILPVNKYGFHPLLCGSAAKDFGADISVITTPSDQRGAPRISGFRVDAGSFEIHPAGANAGPDLSKCIGETVELNGGFIGDSVVWFVNGQYVESSNTYLHEVLDELPDTISLSVYSVSSCGLGSDVSVVSTSIPQGMTITASSTNVCSGEEITLSTFSPDVTNYSWDNGVGNGVPFTPASSQIYTVTGLDICGETQTESINITVNESPKLEDVFIETCESSYFWNQTSSSYSSPGIYKDTILSSLGCDSIISLNLTFLFGSSVSVNDTAIAGNDYTLPNGAIVNESGTYIDTLMNTNGCDSIFTLNLTLLEDVGIRKLNKGIFSIYPNPSIHGIFTVDYSLNSELKVMIFGIGGRLVYNQVIYPGTKIDISRQDRGMYVFLINDGTHSYFKKLLY